MNARNGILINRFDGGLNTKVAFYVGAPNESPDLLNVDFDDVGAVQTRRGLRLIDTINAAGADLMHSYRNDSTSQILVVNQGDLMVSNNAQSFVTAPGGDSVFWDGNRVHGHTMQNHAFLSDRISTYKWDGSSVSKWGIDKPSVVPTPSQFGDQTGYTGSVSYIRTNSDIFNTETLASPTLNIDATCNHQFVVTAPADTEGATYLNLYRRKNPEEEAFYLLTSVVNTGSDATMVDTLEDLTYSSTFQVATDPRPPKFRVFTGHLGYMFGAGEENPTWLYYSYINQPSKFSGSRYIRIGDGDGYAIRGMAEFAGHLVITKDNGAGSGSVWLLYTPDAEPQNWNLTRLDTPYGGIAPEAMLRFGNYITYLNRNGIYYLEEGSVGQTTTDALSYNIEPDVFRFVSGFIENVSGAVYKNKAYWTVPYQSNTNNRTYVYDYIAGRDQQTGKYGAWSRYDWAMSKILVHDSKLYGMDYSGNFYECDYVYYVDNAAAIESRYETMAIYGIDQHHDNVKIWRYAWITVANTGNYNLEIYWAEDFDDVGGEQGHDTVNLDPNGTTWGSGSAWGTSTWDPGQARQRVRINLGGYRSKSIQFKFKTDAANANWKVYDMLLEYNVRGIRVR